MRRAESQLPKILEHPFLRSTLVDTYPFRPPSYTLPSKLQGSLPFVVIQDLCFLAYLNKEFFLCETTLRIEERVYGEERCWEKRWAKMLHRWKEGEEMDWEDLPFPIKPSEYIKWYRPEKSLLSHAHTSSDKASSAACSSSVCPQRDPFGDESESRLSDGAYLCLVS